MSDTIYQLIEKYSKVNLPIGSGIEFEPIEIDFENIYEGAILTGLGGVTPTSFKSGHTPWNKGKECDYVSKARKEYWIQWRKDNPNYKDKWKKYIKKDPKDIIKADNTTPLNKTIIQCPHCDKKGNVGNMKRWHFDKCKTQS